ncbi:MAG: hypothetical protein J6Q39_08795 [Bacteroidales bacterium]|jgi:hypothetical protein|nr:hypothetical protein [Bacteroidales bacterium]
MEDDRNKKNTRLNLLSRLKVTSASQTSDDAKIIINNDIAILKLTELAKLYVGITNPQGFLTDLRVALGIPDSRGASKYGYVVIPKKDGSYLQASLRITNHNSNVKTYIDNDVHFEYNLSIVISKRFKTNTFKAHDNVRLDEYVYYGKRMAKVENPLTQIVNSIIGFLRTGVYEDTTGIAFKNSSPM